MKLGRKLVSLLLALVMVFSLTATASAAEKVTVKLSPNITVTLDGEAQAMADVKGNPVYPVLYGGTTYLPVRAVGNMLGLDVDWDQATQTVLLTTSDGKTSGGTTGSKAPATAKPTDITVSINPGITVKLDGEVQKMTNVNGDPVYPMLYGGTTYLPVRAVSNMLDVDVDWDGATQTVILERNSITGDFAINTDDLEATRKTLEALGYTKDEIDNIIAMMADQNAPVTDPFGSAKTSEDAKKLGDDHIAKDWAELDWSTASKGYVRVKINNKIAACVDGSVVCFDSENVGGTRTIKTDLSLTDRWQNIPLWPVSGEHECLVSIRLVNRVGSDEFDTLDTLRARFTTEFKYGDDNDPWLMSNIYADYENAPNTCAKAKELTKDCKTDAEKITAIFNWVASNISYDQTLYAKDIETAQAGLSWNRDDENMNPDIILASKTGVCRHYAALMTAMLRSLDIPCKWVAGDTYTGRTIEGWNDDTPGWEGHAWVSVSPDTEGLNKTALGIGTDTDGWLRLDPTWGDTASGRADAAVDANHESTEWW